VERGVYFDGWFPRQHCYHPSLPPRRLRMVDDLVDYRATVLVWSALGGGSLALPYLEQEALGPVDARARFYGTVNDAEFIAACHERGIKVFGIVFEAQGWEFPVELDDDESTVLALNELRGVGHRDWLGLREFSGNRYPNLWPAFEHYFPDGLRDSDGNPVDDLIECCVARDIHGNACHARWVECPDRDHQCYYMDRNNPVWREYLKAVIRIQIDAGVDGIQLDEAELPLGALQYGACFCRDCMKGFRAHLQQLPPQRRPAELADTDLSGFHYGDWLLARGYDFVTNREQSPLFGEYYAFQCQQIRTHFAELAEFARSYGRSKGRQVLVSGNFFNVDAHYLPLAEHVDLIITEMRNTTYQQPEWYRRVDAFARAASTRTGAAARKDVVVVENPYGGVVPDLVRDLSRGRGYDRLRLSLYEAAAFGANMTAPYGSWMGSTIQDSFWAPHDLLVDVQGFLAEHDELIGVSSRNDLAVVDSVASNRALVHRADASDNLTNARDDSVVVPHRVATRALTSAGAPYDEVLFVDGVVADDLTTAADLRRYRTVVLPACWSLTERQLTALMHYLDDGGHVVVTGDVATTAAADARARLLGHPRCVRASHDDAGGLQRHDPQVQVSGGLAVNLHAVPAGTAAHLVNYGYDDERDAASTCHDVSLRVRLPHACTRGVLVRPNQDDCEIAVKPDGDRLAVEVDAVEVYAIVLFVDGANDSHGR
jgi:hypothetical protein